MIEDDKTDFYLGSGKLLKKAIKKYGRENFKKEILFTFFSKEEALLKEAQIVTLEIVNDKKSYNLKIGGEGGWDFINEKLKTDKEYKKNFYSKHSLIIKKLHKNGKLDGWKINRKVNYFKNKNHSEESKIKISKNNGNTTPSDIIQQRIIDYESIEKCRGYISILAKRWNISHTQVRRFISSI